MVFVPGSQVLFAYNSGNSEQPLASRATPSHPLAPFLQAGKHTTGAALPKERSSIQSMTPRPPRHRYPESLCLDMSQRGATPQPATIQSVPSGGPNASGAPCRRHMRRCLCSLATSEPRVMFLCWSEIARWLADGRRKRASLCFFFPEHAFLRSVH